MGPPQGPFKWDASVLKLLPLYARLVSPPSSSIAACDTRIYYVFGKDFMIHTCIHLGVQEHPVEDGEYQDFKERICTLVGK
jgi:hypothetical protein